MAVHSTAVVDKAARLAADVEVGPHCYIGAGVEIGSGTRLGPGCMVHGPTVIGTGNVFYGQASIGGDSQAKRGAAGILVMGDNNMVREYCTINRSSEEGSETRIGSGNWLMACSHVAHDCVLGDNVVIANAVLLGGEVEVGSGAVLGGAAAIHQQCRIGALAIIGGTTVVHLDVPPFALYSENKGRIVVDINKIGLERAGNAEKVDCVRKAYRALYHEGLSLKDAASAIAKMAASESFLQSLASFLTVSNSRGLVRPHRRKKES